MDITYFKTVSFAISFLRAWGVKTADYFGNVIDRLTKSLYEGNIDELEFTQIFEDLLYGQLREAWMVGMEQNGLTESDMTPEFETELGGILSNENGQILDFADAIVQAKQDGVGVDAMLSRGQLWQSRYQDVVSRAATYTADTGDRFAWRLGATEQHCASCSALDGIVATAADWEASGYHPQQPDNEMLECHGWRCDCRMERTDEKVTEGGIPNA